MSVKRWEETKGQDAGQIEVVQLVLGIILGIVMLFALDAILHGDLSNAFVRLSIMVVVAFPLKFLSG